MLTEVSAQDRPPVLLIGSGHWSNPGKDLIAPEFDDMLSSHRQREIADCIERLATFAPTKVALEVSDERTDQLQDAYQRYREGTFTLAPTNAISSDCALRPRAVTIGSMA